MAQSQVLQIPSKTRLLLATIRNLLVTTQVVDRTIIFTPGIQAPLDGNITSITQDPNNIEKTSITVSSKDDNGKVKSEPITQEFGRGQTPVFTNRRFFPIGYQKNIATAADCKAISKDAVIAESYLTNEASACGGYTEVFAFNKQGNSFSENYTSLDLLNMPHRRVQVCCVPAVAIQQKANQLCGKVNLTNGKGNKNTSRKATCQQASKGCITDYYRINQPFEVVNNEVVDNIENFITNNTAEAKSCVTAPTTTDGLNATLVSGNCCPAE